MPKGDIAETITYKGDGELGPENRHMMGIINESNTLMGIVHCLPGIRFPHQDEEDVTCIVQFAGERPYVLLSYAEADKYIEFRKRADMINFRIIVADLDLVDFLTAQLDRWDKEDAINEGVDIEGMTKQ